MTNRSHLTPVTITDKRGRTTTVYRNPGRSNPSQLGGALPGAPAPASAGGSPLPQPSSRRTKELREFVEEAETRVYSFRGARILHSAAGQRAVALAMDLVDAGALDSIAAQAIVGNAGAWDPKGPCTDALRTAAVFAPRADDLTTIDTHWTQRITLAVGGYRLSGQGWDGKPIATTEQLDACVAVTDFILRFDKDPAHWGLIRRNASPSSRRGMERYDIIANDGLGRLLRERPADLDRIIAYVEERGMAANSEEDAHRLRAWLDTPDTPGAVLSGWL